MWNQRLSQLTDSDRKKIQVNRAQGMTLDQLARRFGVSSATISRAISELTKKQTAKAAS
jgi:IS30 family transposase